MSGTFGEGPIAQGMRKELGGSSESRVGDGHPTPAVVPGPPTQSNDIPALLAAEIATPEEE